VQAFGSHPVSANVKAQGLRFDLLPRCSRVFFSQLQNRVQGCAMKSMIPPAEKQ
jgi:hypothetical protein